MLYILVVECLLFRLEAIVDSGRKERLLSEAQSKALEESSDNLEKYWKALEDRSSKACKNAWKTTVAIKVAVKSEGKQRDDRDSDGLKKKILRQFDKLVGR
jgi:hypothetical protein